MKDSIIIRHRRFIIRKFTMNDTAALVQHFGHPAIMKGTRNLVWKYKSTHARKYLREKLRQYRRKKPLIKNNEIDTLGYAIEVGGQMVGGAGVTLNDSSAEIGYWLAKPYWGKGIMTAAVRAWTWYVFHKFKVKRIEAKVFSGNNASVRVLQKNKFIFESRLIKKDSKNKKLSDQLLFFKEL